MLSFTQFCTSNETALPPFRKLAGVVLAFIAFSSVLLLSLIATPVHAKDSWGYVSLTAEMSPDTTSCAANESLFDVVTKEFNTETVANVSAIGIEVRNRTTNAVVRSGSGAPQTVGLCMDPVTEYLFIIVTGGTNYHDLVGTYGIDTNPSFYVGRHIRAHAHVAPLADGPSIRHRSPINMWSNTQPTSFSFDLLSMPTIHGGSGLYNINLTVSSPVYSTTILQSGGLGTYTIDVPGASLSDGWLGWGFYVGLNGGTPNPISAYSGTESFGLDRQPPVVSAVHAPVAPLETEQVRLMGLVQDQLTLSGLANIRIWLDGALVQTCTYAVQSAQGPTTGQQCDSVLFGPFPSGSTHVYDVVAMDTAGNTATSTNTFAIGCNKAIEWGGVNPGQFKGCFYKTDTAGNITGSAGDAPSGPVLPASSPIGELITIVDFDWGSGAPNAQTGNDYFKGTWVGTHAYPPGRYAFYLTADDCGSMVGETVSGGDLWRYFFDLGQGGVCNGTRMSHPYASSFSTGGSYTIALRYTETTGNSSVKLQYKRLCDDVTPGVNQFTGCLYARASYSYSPDYDRPLAPAPVGPVLASPVPPSATALSFDWGTTISPDPAVVGTDNYAMHWTGSFTFPAGVYKFTSLHDDGMLVTIGATTMNAQTIADAGVETDVFYYTFPTDQTITIGIEYAEGGGASLASFGWEKIPSLPILCDESRVGTNRLEGCAWNSSPGYNRIDDTVSAGLRTQDATATTSPGLPVVAANFDVLNMSWNMSSPAPVLIGNNSYLLQWKGNFTFAPGTYAFTQDEGSGSNDRIYVDGVEACFWYTNTCNFRRTFTATTTLNFRLTHSHNSGIDSARFGWKQTCMENEYGVDQFTGCLYNSNFSTNNGIAPDGPFLSNPVAASSTALDFDWSTGAPAPGYSSTDLFGVRYWGAFHFPAGTYKFTTSHDDGLYVWINGTQMLDAWTLATWGKETDVFYHTFATDQTATITLQYYERYGTAGLSFRWEKLPSTPVLCDTTRVGTNRFEGCLFNDRLGAYYHPTRPMLDANRATLLQPDVTDPANTQAVFTSTTSLNTSWYGLSSPNLFAVGPQTYGIVWNGNFTFPAGEYTFWKGNRDLAVRMNGACLFYLCDWYNTEVRQFATTTTVKLTATLQEGTGRFGWTQTPKNIGVSRINPYPNPYGIFPGYAPSATAVRSWAYGTWFNNSYGISVPTMSGVTSLEIYPNTGTPPPYVVANSGTTTAYIDLYDPTTGTWKTVWSRIITTIPYYFEDPSSFIAFPMQNVSSVRLRVSPTGSPALFRGFGTSNFAFAGPGVTAANTDGYRIRSTSIAGLEDTVSVDGVLPSGIAKTGTWPQTCAFVPFGICDVFLSLTTDRNFLGSNSDNPFGKWTLDDGSGSVAFDSSGYNNTGTLVSGPVWTTGQIGGALSFDGVDDHVSVPGIELAGSPFTVSFWLNPNTRTNYNNQVIGVNGWGSFVFHTTSDGSVYVGTDVTNRLTPTQLPSNTVTLGTWQHFTFTYANGVGSFYKNGNLLAQKSGMVNPTSWGGFRIGTTDTNTINGKADDVRVYNRALSSAEVNTLFTTGSSVTPTSPSAFFTYPSIIFTSTGMNTGATGKVGALLKTWGFDLLVTPSSAQSALPGTPMTYDVMVTSRNGWGGTVSFAASTTPAHPTVTTSFILPTVFLPIGGTAMTAVTIFSASTTPQQPYRINVSATGQSPEGPFTQYSNPTPVLFLVSPGMFSAAGADLVAQNLSSSNADPIPGEILTFSGLISNFGGDTASSSSFARFCVDDANCLTSGANTLGLAVVPILGSGESWMVTSGSWVATAGAHTIYLCADVNTEVSEANETNNCQSLVLNVVSPNPPTLTVSVTPSTVDTTEPFQLLMTSTNADFCTWSRSSSYGGDWSNQPIPTSTSCATLPCTSYDSGLIGPWTVGDATWTFVCTNAIGGSVPTSATLTVIGAPVLSVSPEQRGFGDVPVNTTKTGTFTVSNEGAVGSMLKGKVTSDDPTRFTCISGCDYSGAGIAVGSPWTVTIEFAPGAVVALFTANITFTGTNTSPASSFVAPVWGSGSIPVWASSLDFGNVIVGRSKELILTMTNSGGSLITDNLLLPFPVYTCVGGCAVSIPAGGSQSITIRFVPTAVTAYNGNAWLENNPTVTFPFTGAGVMGTFKFMDI